MDEINEKSNPKSIHRSFLVSPTFSYAQKNIQSVRKYACKKRILSWTKLAGKPMANNNIFSKRKFFLTVAKFEDNIELQVKSDADEYFCRTGQNTRGFISSLIPNLSCTNPFGQAIVFNEKIFVDRLQIYMDQQMQAQKTETVLS